MKKYAEMSDEDLKKFFDPDPESAYSLAVLVHEYKRLRDHHIEETAKLTAKDRSLILRMAANIAGPMSALPSSNYTGIPFSDIGGVIAKASLIIAKAIIAQVDA